MSKSTLEKLQTLKDAEFHALGDEILPRISSSYYPIVPLGRNQKGDSIVGQPDSYVGDSPKTCRIAIQYTVQKKWWSKVVEDVKEAKKACPMAQEIVLVLPQNTDRGGPKKGKALNWLDDAIKAAAPAELTLVHGRKLEHLLDTSCQDLRLNYFGIPYSRLSWHALIAGCSKSSASTLGRLKLLERYDSNRYVDRNADDYLFTLWQESYRNLSGRSFSSNRRTIIPLIADSGIGKTSLLARFTERASPNTPVLLLLARDLSLNSTDSLTNLVMDRLQGSLDAKLRSSEESHLAKIIEGKTPITIVLDGLDETTNAEGLRKVIDNWIWSRLGKLSILIVSSRPEFWRKCRDASWSRYILRKNEHPKTAKSLRHEKELSSLDPMQGIELPGKFSHQELSKAWVLGGQKEEQFWQLPKEIREELLHPFSMRSALDLLATGVSLDDLGTRTSIMNQWIKSRLKKEINEEARLTEALFRECLLIISRLAAENNGWVRVDNLKTVPRFDSSHPPGKAVEQLISANLLETHPEHRDQIRFSFEAVQDFFLAESIVRDIMEDPENVAKQFEAISFSNAVTRLERIGDQIADQPFRENFVLSLAKLDGIKAAVVIKSAINAYSTKCREFVVSKVAELLKSKMRAEQALATQLLGRMVCEESKKVLETHWTSRKPTKRIHGIVSSAAISHGIVALTPIVFKTWWFIRDNFFIDLRPELMATTREFRESLADYAFSYITTEGHSDNYQRALMVLSYLDDERAVETINKRTQNEFPLYYESLCLLAIGSPKAIEVYSSLVNRFIELRKSGLDKKEENLRSSVVPHARIANLVTQEVENFVCNQLDSDEVQRQLIGHFLAKWLGTERLLLQKVKCWNVDGFHIPSDFDFGKKLGANNWIDLWHQSSETEVKKTLLQISRGLQNAQVEEILIECLNNIELAGYAVQSLGFIGSQRASPAIRNLLLKEVESDQDWITHAAFITLARLRDPASVTDMVTYIESTSNSDEYDGAIGLASIGTEEAETALLNLKNQSDEFLVRGLVHFGNHKCIYRAIEIAKKKDNGPAWLAEHCKFSMWGFHGRSRRQYRKDVEIEPYLEYVLGNQPNAEVYSNLRPILESIDNAPVRKLFRKWYDFQGTTNDMTLKSSSDSKLSDIAFRELSDRGDSYVLTNFIEREIERYKDFQIHDLLIEDLGVFDRTKVQSTLRTMLTKISDEKSRRVILDLIGHLGDQVDFSTLNELSESESNIIANAALEANLRLTDPLRLAENW